MRVKWRGLSNTSSTDVLLMLQDIISSGENRKTLWQRSQFPRIASRSGMLEAAQQAPIRTWIKKRRDVERNRKAIRDRAECHEFRWRSSIYRWSSAIGRRQQKDTYTLSRKGGSSILVRQWNALCSRQTTRFLCTLYRSCQLYGVVGR